MDKSHCRFASCIIFFLLCILPGPQVSAATNWSTATHDVYPGDFDGDGRDDLLVIARSNDQFSGIFKSVNGQPSTQLQSWNSGFLGINWHSGAYTAVVADFSGDGRADVLLQSTGSGNSYLLKTNSEGKLYGIHQIISGWGQNSFRIIAGKFNSDARADVFLQPRHSSGSNYVILADSNGLLTATGQTWTNNYLGFKWSAQNSVVHAGDFNGDGRDDLLVQAKPDIALIDYDIPIPVPVFKPQSFGITLSNASGQFTSIQQLWSRKDFGADWSPNTADVVIGDFNGDGRDDVALVARKSGQPTYIMLTNSNAQISSSPAQTLSSGALGTNWTAADYRMMAADFNGDGRAEIYREATSSSGSNDVVSFGSAGTANSVGAHNAPSVTDGMSTAVGRVPGELEVDLSGAATYSIPIDVPTGTGGLKPNLAISYSSSAGSGLLGVGWDLAGLSEISRCGQTFAQDGNSRAVDRSTNDRFCLDGNKLRITNGGSYGAHGTTYQTEIESFSRVTSYTSGGEGSSPSSGPQYFKVEGKDGLFYYYGQTTDARIEVTGTTVARAWALNRVEDRNGNYLTISYTEETGSYRPASIEWTRTGSGSGPFFRAKFYYEARPTSDVNIGYFAGGAITESKRLDRIDVEAFENSAWTLVRRYDATYEATVASTGRSRLHSVKLCSATACVPQTTFEYQNGTSGWITPVYYFAATEDSMGYVHTIDINGDGNADLVYPKSSYWYYRLWNRATSSFGAETNSSIGTGSGSTAAYLTARPISLVEGGKVGLLVRTTVGNAAVLAWNGTALVPRYTNLSGTLLDKKSWIGDFDGDGRDDFLYLVISGTTAQFMLSRATNVGTTYDFSSAVSVASINDYGTFYDLGQSDRNQLLHDFNGDGKTDIFFWTNKITYSDPSDYLSYMQTTQGKVLLSTGTAFTEQTIWSCQIGGNDYYTGHGCGSPSPAVADFNGDGLADILYTEREYTSTRRIAFGSGTGVTGAIAIASAAAGDPIDYDNDGRTDLVSNGSVYRFNGTGFDAPVSIGTMGTSIRVTDMNGDGLQDIAYFSNNSWVARTHMGVAPDLLSRVTDGFGNYSAPTYAPLTDSSVYTKGSGSAYPIVDLTVPQYAVKVLASSTGLASPAEYTMTFAYRGLRADVTGRGLLGFEMRTVTDGRSSHEVRTEETYSQTFPFIGMATNVAVYQPNSNITIAETTVTPAVLTLNATVNNQRYFPYAQTVVDEKREVSSLSSYNGALVTRTTTTGVYDNYGNMTNQTVVVTDMQADSQLKDATYRVETINTADIGNSALTAQLLTSWCIGTVANTEVRSTPYGESTYKSRMTEYHHDFDKCRVTKEIAEPNNPGGNTKVTTDLVYYPSGASRGQLQSKTVTGVAPSPFPAPAVRSETYEYDPAGPYVTKVTNTLGQSVGAQWRIGLGVQKRRTDVNGNSVDYTYDSFGRLAFVNLPDGTQTAYQYLACQTGCGYGTGRFEVTSATSGGGVLVSRNATVFDQLERELQSTRWMFGGAQSHTLTEYDILGRVSKTSAPLWTGGHVYWTTSSYDLLGRPVDVQRPVSETNSALQTVHWDYKGLQVTQTDPETKTTTRWSNAIGQVVKMIDAANGVTEYGYDHFGNLVRTEDPAGNEATGVFDGRGRKNESHDPDMGDWYYTYNSLGQLLKQKDAKLQETMLTYDPIGRLKTRTEPEGLTTFYYDTAAHGIGMLASVAAPNGYGESYSYDALSRPSDLTTAIDGVSYTVSTGYNTQGQVETVTYPESFPTGSRFKIKYVYEAGMMKRVEDANSASTVYWSAIDTNAAGAVISEIQGNGVATNSTYDVVSGLLKDRYAGPGYNGSVQSLHYEWDRVGNLKQRKDTRPGVSLTEDFYYDNLHRLDYSKLNNVMNLDMAYNAIGNVTVKSDVSSSTFNYSTAQAGCSYYAHTQPHAVRKAGSAVYCYDQNGNMTSRDGNALDWYSYNLPKKLRKGSNSSEFTYGADRSRYKTITVNGGVTETTISIGSLFERVTRTGSTVFEYKHYIPGLDGASAIVTRRSNSVSDVRYLHKDHLGSIDAITNESGAVVVHLSYDAFGKRRNPETWNGSPSAGDWTQINAVTHQAFTSHEQLDAVDLVHMKGRVFDPTTGRFISSDPFVQAPLNSQSLNRYSYVMNNPLSFTDPSGYWSLGKHLKAIGKFHHLPSLKNMFDAIRTFPGQKGIDNYVLTHRWAYQLGYAAAVVSSYWIGGYGGAVYQAYYTYVATGSMTEAVKAGVVTAAVQYVTNLWSTGNGFQMNTGGGGVLHAAPDASGTVTGPNVARMLADAARRAPTTPQPYTKTMDSKEVGEFRKVLQGLSDRVSAIRTEADWREFNPGFYGSFESENASWQDAQAVIATQIDVMSLQTDMTLIASGSIVAGQAGAKAGLGKLLPKGAMWLLRTDRAVRYDFYYEIHPMSIEFWMIDRYTNVRYEFSNWYWK